jgi:hypothetical protein
MEPLTATERFAATIAAQIGGLFILLLVAIPFPSSATNVGDGKEWMEIAEVLILLVLLLGIGLAFKRSRKCGGSFDDPCVNVAISTYVICDIPILLFLVCQQGGICRSVLMPVFFLIPIAHVMVERRERWVYSVLGTIVLSITIAFLVSLYVGVPSITGVNHIPLGLGNLRITDFSAQAHAGYDWAIFISAIIAVMIPLIQRAFVLFVKTLFKEKEKEAS